MSIATKLTTIRNTLKAIKQAIINKGQTPSGDITTYPDAIGNITTIKNQDKTITSNGSYTADSGYTGFGTVTVNVPTGITPSGTKSITENGTYDVTNYASASVNVASTDELYCGLPFTLDKYGFAEFSGAKSTLTFPDSLTDLSGFTEAFATSYFDVDFNNIKIITNINSAFKNSCIRNANFPKVTWVESASYAFEGSQLESVSFPVLKSVYYPTSPGGLDYAFKDCLNLTEISFPELKTVGDSSFEGIFSGCRSLASVSFPKLAEIRSSAFKNAFDGCIGLTEISFPAYYPQVGGASYDSQFENMLDNTDGITVHFPSNAKSYLSSYISGFGGDNVTVLFDLPAT